MYGTGSSGSKHDHLNTKARIQKIRIRAFFYAFSFRMAESATQAPFYHY